FLDNAPLEERRTQAVYTRRASKSAANDGLGILDAAAIDRVTAEAWPQPTNPDAAELLQSLANNRRAGKFVPCRSRRQEAQRLVESKCWIDSKSNPQPENSKKFPPLPRGEGRGEGEGNSNQPIAENKSDAATNRMFWLPAERLPLLQAVYPNLHTEPALTAPESETKRQWERSDAIRELVRG